ncbi:cytochrome P450 4C1-like [Rhopilema esculentum]|uniref:cytochrome P450 4C1-like n=1 Tax=Rhopilema esculentum TaxID=499914 RepID=UPI0031D8B192
MFASYSIVGIVAFCAFVLFLWIIISWWKNPYKCIPGPTGWPIIGNTFEFSGNTDQHALFLQWTRQYGRIFKYYVLFGGYRIYITDPSIARHILVTNFKNYRRQDVLRKLLPGFGTGLITANGRTHATQRKQLNPFFSLANVQKFFPIFVEKTNALIALWNDQLMNSSNKAIELDVLEKLTHLSLDIIGICAFGYNFNCIMGGHSEESKATDTVLRGNFDLQRRSLEQMIPLFTLFRSSTQKEFIKAETCLKNLINQVIQDRRKHLENGDATAENDLLSILFSMVDERGLKLSSKDIYHQVFTFLISGHETTSLTIMWTLYLLAKHPDIQTEVRQEISRFTNPPCAEITWEQIERMKLLDNCIKEAMRLYPVAITTDRTSIGADTLGPHKILPGTHVMVGTGTLHRDEEFWKDPDTFNPCRFDEIGDDKHRSLLYQFLPFSRGPRMCIGYRFATAEIKVALVKLLSNFQFTFVSEKDSKMLDSDISTISALTLKPFPRLSLRMEHARAKSI